MSTRRARSRFLQIVTLSALGILFVVFVFHLNNNNDNTRVPWQDEFEHEPDPVNETILDESDLADVRPKTPLETSLPLPQIVGTTKTGFKVKFALLDKFVSINPHANVLNRPHLVVPKDDYLGTRPHVDAEVDTQMILNTCRGSYEKLEFMRNTSRCLTYLASDMQNYTILPPVTQRASRQDPRDAEYENADGHGNSNSTYVSLGAAEPANATSRGTCPGPIIPFHVYWRGPATWRVELFIKAYLYTQNLPCSQLHFWLDSDPFPTAVYDMLNTDPLFARFLPLVERGDIVVRAWNFPRRIPVPTLVEDDPGEDVKKSVLRNAALGRETSIAPNIVEDHTGQRFLTLSQKQMSFLPVAVSDAVRFVVLHMYGGVYFDMDVLMLRDMRPLVLPRNHSFAERWAQHVHSGGYNTAILSMTANSSLSTYFLRGGVSMGLNFHPLVLGIMARKDGRNKELQMFEHALFDPLWTDYAGPRDGRCITPCHQGDYSWAFRGSSKSHEKEWQGYQDPQLVILGTNTTTDAEIQEVEAMSEVDAASIIEKRDIEELTTELVMPNATADAPPTLNMTRILQRAAAVSIGYKDSFTLSPAEIRHLHNLSVISTYDSSKDKYPPTNRTMQNFYRGAYTYHIHNQWSAHPEPNSWLSVIMDAHNGFFAGSRTNVYGEGWTGSRIQRYNLWPEFF